MAVLGLHGVHNAEVASISENATKNQLIFNDLGFDDGFKSLPSRTIANLKIALPLRKYPHFRLTTSDFHHVIGCPLRGGLSRPPTSDRTPELAQNWSHLGCRSDHFGVKFVTEEHAR